MRLRALLALCLFFTLTVTLVRAQSPTPSGRLAITSPKPGAEIGGVVSILGSADLAGMRDYTLAFGAGASPLQWIPIASHPTGVLNGRLAFWDTTTTPDGIYTLRLRVTLGDSTIRYEDYLVEQLLVANAPRTPRVPTVAPSLTPTQTPVPTASPTPMPTLALEDGISPYLYVTQMDQYDPLCLNWKQRYSIWVSNIGMVTVTHIVLTDTLPSGCQPTLSGSTPGALFDGSQVVVWTLEAMGPGEARKLELLVDVAPWLEVGKWIVNRVTLSCDQVPWVASSEQTLLSDCAWLKKTGTAVAFTMPTAAATPIGTLTPGANGAARPSATPLVLSVPPENVRASLDLLTLIIAVSLGVLLVVTVVLLYRQLVKRRP